MTTSGTQGKKQPSTSGVDVAARIMHSWKSQLWFQGWGSQQEENKAHFTVGFCIFSSFKSKKPTQPALQQHPGEQHLLHCLGAGLHGQRKSSTDTLCSPSQQLQNTLCMPWWFFSIIIWKRVHLLLPLKHTNTRTKSQTIHSAIHTASPAGHYLHNSPASFRQQPSREQF